MVQLSVPLAHTELPTALRYRNLLIMLFKPHLKFQLLFHSKFSITSINQEIIFQEINAVYSESYIKHIN